jgi:hypothetical protein
MINRGRRFTSRVVIGRELEKLQELQIRMEGWPTDGCRRDLEREVKVLEEAR